MLSIITWSVVLVLTGFTLGVGWQRARCNLNHQLAFEDYCDEQVFEESKPTGTPNPVCLVHDHGQAAEEARLLRLAKTRSFLDSLQAGSSKAKTTDWSDDVLTPYADYGIVRGQD